MPNYTRAEDTHCLSGLKVLLADDSPDNQLIVSFMLKSAGAEVAVVDNGQAALDQLREKKYDVVLMDLQMPVMDGFEALTRLRNQGNRTPVIALTAHTMSDERQKCLESGFTEHIAKPIDQTTLLEQLSSFVVQ